MVDAIRKSVLVAADVSTAFHTWVEEIDAWWPKSHSLSKDPQTTIAIEPRRGGRFFERASDGTESEFGAVLVFDPPHRLVYQWFLGTGAERPTEVDVRFVAHGDGTRVDVEHRAGDAVPDAWATRKGGYARAWGDVLKAYTTTITRQETS